MHLFFTPDIVADTYTLSEEESKHCTRVLRLGHGDTVYLVDGIGGRYTAIIQDANPKKCQLQIIDKQPEYGKLSYTSHIAVAPTKNMDRMEWFVEKAVEIGISEITFLLCEHSERRNLRLDRLEKIAISAMKQSQKGYLPQLHNMTPFRDFILKCEPSHTFIAHLEDDATKGIKDYFKYGQPHCIMIGPEGDFSAGEIAAAYKTGIKPVTLGQSRLRTETAALVACHTLHVLNDLYAPL
ncbi:16S rRNA (uracil(1498)-N(3))-methyltransferase [Pontibacter akesuensis]|uniref:Ribosomal RNA small subunit methyltransferase E n=1 Tax=Pontibacter akesuensis TaxID=388950 RepID=A0A1I7G6D7_9BACT|nr:16S rRNA (uracil(1498)-N(3))-methyltransferase [Pontibacter akesuensis]GHA58548.1 ribosomal RNA small subunit methyltransferase E [Pontibacter akesuensis]SFU43988.1 16S rRNA (uracil1498-N3)-methyltransferase [Pontibacter akesuensis]